MSVNTTTSSTTSPTVVRHRWVPAVGALAGLALTVKAGLIIGTGDGIAEQPMSVLYLCGLAVGAAAAIGFGLRRSPLPLRIATAVVAPLLLVLWIIGLGEAVEPVFGLVSDAQYVRDEGPIGLLGVVLLIAAYAGYSHDQRR